MPTTTRFIAQVVLQRIETTTSDQLTGFNGSSSSTKEKVHTDLSLLVTEDSLGGVMAKLNYSLSLAYATVAPKPAIIEEAPDAVTA